MHLWPFSKSKFNLKSDRVIRVAPASPIEGLPYLPMSGRNSTNWDWKGWPGSEIQMYYSCPWMGSEHCFPYRIFPEDMFQTVHISHCHNRALSTAKTKSIKTLYLSLPSSSKVSSTIYGICRGPPKHIFEKAQREGWGGRSSHTRSASYPQFTHKHRLAAKRSPVARPWPQPNCFLQYVLIFSA